MSHTKDGLTVQDVLEKAKAYITDEEQLKVIEQAYLLRKKNMLDSIVKRVKNILFTL